MAVMNVYTNRLLEMLKNTSTKLLKYLSEGCKKCVKVKTLVIQSCPTV